MADITLYTETDYQGDSITVPLYELGTVLSDFVWHYRSAKLNGNKLKAFATSLDFDPVNSEETFTSEDVPDFALLFKSIENILSITTFPMSKGDIIVGMDIHNSKRGFRTLAFSWLPKQGEYNFSECYENYTLDITRGTLAILNTAALSAVSVKLNAETVTFDSAELVAAQIGSEITVDISYSSETDSIDVNLDSSYFTSSIEKLDELHFLVHFEYNPTGFYTNAFLHAKEDYSGDNIAFPQGYTLYLRNEEGIWRYKSLESITTLPYALSWSYTNYPENGTGYDFNQYRSYVAKTSIPTLAAIFDEKSSSPVSSVYCSAILPVYLRPINADAPENWLSFVIESTFTSVRVADGKQTYTAFCTNNPEAVQTGVMCFVSEYSFETDVSACTLRYGTLSADGATATWSGETTLNIEYGGADNLIISLAEDAPEGWEITSVTKGEDGWYVDITGTAS